MSLRWLAWILLLATSGHAFAADFIYTVQPGDHPWNLAQRYLKNASLGPALRELNRIPDDRRIMPGTRLRIPQAWLKLETAQVRLLAVAGDTTVQPGGTGAVRAAEPGEMLQAPSSLRTGANGSATLQFADGSLVLVRRDSELQLQQTLTRSLGHASLIGLVLLRGSLENQVTPIGTSGGRFEIRTPAATAAVRGTQFRLVVEPQTTVVRTEVLEGAVNLANAAGQVTAQAAQGSVAQTGQAPGQPVALLPAPSLDHLPERIERLPIDLPITPLAGAAGYRTQIAPDARFSVIASDEAALAPRVRARDVEDGRYLLRVRAIDAQGLEGLSAERALVVHARPEPPLLIEPAPDAVTTSERPSFRWTQADPALTYRLQITRAQEAAAFDEQVLAAASAQPAKDLPTGLYQWRMAAIHSARGQGPWGDAQPFRRVLPGPDVQIAAPQDGSLNLRWPAQPQTARYRLQVARDDSFATPLVDVETELPQYRLQDLKPGLHHVRVLAIGADAYTGPWGGVQTFTVSETSSPYWRALWLLLPALVLF